MLASSGAHKLGTAGWVYEPKWDGVRLLAIVERDGVRLLTRNGNDKATQFPEVVQGLQSLAERSRSEFVLDGEVVAVDSAGRPLRFQSLQSRIHSLDLARSARGTRSRAATSGFTQGAAFIAFDVLAVGPQSLLREPWSDRRTVLEALLSGHTRSRGAIRLGRVDRRGGKRLMEAATGDGWEGLMAKRADAIYSPGTRTSSWVKLKLEKRQEFVVGGFTEPRNTRELLGALLVGYYGQNGQLIYAGHVGTGFTRQSLRALHDALAKRTLKRSPFSEAPVTNEPATWVSPRMVVEVRFNEWTEDGRLRQPVFLGVRDDKEPRSVVLEQ